MGGDLRSLELEISGTMRWHGWPRQAIRHDDVQVVNPGRRRLPLEHNGQNQHQRQGHEEGDSRDYRAPAAWRAAQHVVGSNLSRNRSRLRATTLRPGVCRISASVYIGRQPCVSLSSDHDPDHSLAPDQVGQPANLTRAANGLQQCAHSTVEAALLVEGPPAHGNPVVDVGVQRTVLIHRRDDSSTVRHRLCRRKDLFSVTTQQ